MKDRIYKLQEIPLKRPSIVNNALKFVDQRNLLNLANRDTPYPRSSLLPLVDLALKSGRIRSVKAHTPTKGILSFVDLDTFQDEFDFFIHEVKKGKTELNKHELPALLKSKQTKEKTLRTSLLSFLTGNKWVLSLFFRSTRLFLPLAEKYCTEPKHFVQLAAICQYHPSQISEEICGLLNLLDSKRPNSVLEIGTNRGGTLYLFARFSAENAKLVSVDLHIENAGSISAFARKRQKISLIEGDSTHPSTIRKIKKAFPKGVDFLLLDGDHSYRGIKTDFQNYASMVKPGGMIAFHDIIEDNETRYGVVTGGWSGGVPRFWKEVRSKYRYVEFVKDYNQDGLGIGVLSIPETKSSHSGRCEHTEYAFDSLITTPC